MAPTRQADGRRCVAAGSRGLARRRGRRGKDTGALSACRESRNGRAVAWSLRRAADGAHASRAWRRDKRRVPPKALPGCASDEMRRTCRGRDRCDAARERGVWAAQDERVWRAGRYGIRGVAAQVRRGSAVRRGIDRSSLSIWRARRRVEQFRSDARNSDFRVDRSDRRDGDRGAPHAAVGPQRKEPVDVERTWCDRSYRRRAMDDASRRRACCGIGSAPRGDRDRFNRQIELRA